MHRLIRAATVLVAALALTTLLRTTTTSKPLPPPASATADAPPAMQLENAAASVEVLVDQFLDALAAKDLPRLERLRVTEGEYRNFILPGSVAQGQPPKNFPDTPSQYYWGTMNTKSLYSLQALVTAYGGHSYKRKAVGYAKGIQAYAWYTAYKKLQLTLEDEHGEEVDLRTGSIAEVNGHYKFISYVTG